MAIPAEFKDRVNVWGWLLMQWKRMLMPLDGSEERPHMRSGESQKQNKVR